MPGKIKMSNRNQPQTDAQLLATVRDMVKVQQGNQALKEKELSVEQERIRSNEKIALASIQSQKEDRLAQMNVISKFQIAKYAIIALVSMGIFAIIWYAMHSGNTAFAIELAKMVIPLVVGLFGGYGIGRYKTTTEQKTAQTDE